MISVSSPPVIMGNHKHVQKDKYYWMEREGSEYNVSRKKDIVFCVTLYNESFDDLLCTLTSIAQSVKHSRSIELSSKRVAVCVICDGYERLDDNFIAEAKSMSWMDHRVESQPNDEGLHIFKTVFQPKLLPDSINKTGDDVKNTGDLDIEFCVKPKNRGKLDSHWWFFKKLCIAHQPKYCFQIDAGTMLKRHTLYEMLKVFRRKPDVAAVASNVIIDSKNAFDLLESFQCSDFVIQRASLWSAENFCGYMSVIPGQFCGISWPALIEKNDEGSTPVDRYLSGTECRTAHEKIMFLAEDRVLCAELLTDDGSEYTVDYAIDAECYTDACGTVDELLK